MITACENSLSSVNGPHFVFVTLSFCLLSTKEFSENNTENSIKKILWNFSSGLAKDPSMGKPSLSGEKRWMITCDTIHSVNHTVRTERWSLWCNFGKKTPSNKECKDP